MVPSTRGFAPGVLGHRAVWPLRAVWQVCFFAGWLTFWAVPAARAQNSADVSYSRFLAFRIPFQTDAGDRRLRQVQLYVSTNQGQSWLPWVTVPPDQHYIDFRATQDGLYWFAVRTIDADGRAYPLTMDGARPGLKVVVDTQPPVVRLRELPARPGEVGVQWDVRDENLDPASLRLEYRLVGTTDWIPVAGDIEASGQRYWTPSTNGAVEARLRARDRADNWGEDKIGLGSGANASASPGTGSVGSDASGSRPIDPNLRIINTTRFGLNYRIEEQGKSGISSVELWYTQDTGCRNWQKYREERGADLRPPFAVEVNGEGLYGFTLVVRSGVGLGGRPPQVGEQPQVWIEVDLTKPVVRVVSVEVGRGADLGRLTINWTATDKNLARQPITLSWAQETSGPWNKIASDLDNTGRYIWDMPKDIPYKFFVRVEALDRAGNIGTADTPNPVIVDLSQPKGIIFGVEPLSK